ncbi:MAG: ATP-binding protein, partial [Syntrophales bacterium]
MDAKDLRLRPRKVQLQAVFKAAAVGFALLDLEGRIIMTNPALQKMFGFDRKVIDGMMLGELIHSGEVDKILAQYDELVSGKLEHFQIEMPYSTKEGRSFWGRVTFSLAQESGNGFRYSIAIVEDITEQKLLSNQLIQSQKMEAVARLAGGIAHDFKNLLSAILCYGNILLKNIKEEDPLYTYTMNIMNASSRGISLARQLFIYGQRDISQPQVINLNNLIADMDYMLRNLLREDITMITILDPFLGNVKADPGQIEQVIMNLVVNARDAMSSGGKLVIETANIDIDEPWACLSDSLEPGPYVTLTVTDTGSGIDDETMAHIFEPFFTTKDPDKGTGLGLSVACGIIKQMQGHIEAHSVPGGGATFAIYLPQNFDSLDQPQKTDNFALVP